MTLLCPLPGCRLVRVARDGPGSLTVLAQARHDHARCPTCRTRSTTVHSRYHRRPADLPVSGKAGRLQLAVRRFYLPRPGLSPLHLRRAVPEAARPPCPAHPPPRPGARQDRPRAGRVARRTAARAPGHADQRHHPAADDLGAAAAEHASPVRRRVGAPQGADLRHHRLGSRVTPPPRPPAAHPKLSRTTRYETGSPLYAPRASAKLKAPPLG